MRFFIFLFLAVILQTTVFGYIASVGILFNLVLALIILFGFVKGGYQNMVPAALVAGILLDSISGAPFGVFLFGLVIVALLLDLLSSSLPRDNLFHFFIFATIGIICFEVLVLVFMKIASPGILIPFVGIITSIVYNTLGAFALYFLRRWIIS